MPHPQSSSVPECALPADCRLPRARDLRRAKLRSRLLHVRRVVAAIAADDLVFSRRRSHHELVRLRSAHRARIRLDDHVLQPAAIKNAAIGVVMFLVGNVEPGRIDVERVRVLHHELPHPQQPRLRTRLIAKLGLDLVPDLRQLFVAAQLLARDVGHDFFVRHAEAQVGALAVFQAKHVVAHHRPSARWPPKAPADAAPADRTPARSCPSPRARSPMILLNDRCPRKR